jgi:hypothetical protein
MACQGEQSATKAPVITPVTTRRAPDSAIPAAVATDTVSTKVDSTTLVDSVITTGNAAGTPAVPTPQQRRDSAIAFASREPDCAKAPADSESRYFHSARPSREFFADSFCFSVDGSRYTVTSSGDGFRLNPKEKPYPFRIRVDENFDMTFLGYRVIGSRLYFLYEMTDSEDGGGGLEAVDKRTLVPSWAKPAKISFNVGDPLITDSAAYMTGINEAGKVRLSDGKFIWKHVFIGGFEPLPNGLLYNAFDTPVLDNGQVRFIPDSATSRSAPVLIVDDKTGLIVAPEMLKGQKPACTGEQPSC